MNLPEMAFAGLSVLIQGGIFYRMGGMSARLDQLEKRTKFKLLEA